MNRVLVDVLRKAKDMTINLEKLIGSGATSEVYKYDENKVIKLYDAKCSASSLRWEYDKMLSAYKYKLPVPKVHQIIEYEGRFGYIMEYIPGETLKEVLNKDIMSVTAKKISIETFTESFFKYIRLTARCLHDIHKMETAQIETMDDRLKRDLRENLFLTEDEKNIVTRIIDSLPKGKSVCHGDPNPNNIMVNGDSFRLIDWVNAGIGNPMYDIAEYVLLSRPSLGKIPADTPSELIEFYYKNINLVIPTFLDEYEKISGRNLSDYEKWFVPLLVSKLNSNRTMEEKNLILYDIRKRINNLYK